MTEMMKGLPLLCLACGHRWLFTAEVGTIMDAFMALLVAQSTCPKCGNHSKAKTKYIVIASDTPYAPKTWTS